MLRDNYIIAAKREVACPNRTRYFSILVYRRQLGIGSPPDFGQPIHADVEMLRCLHAALPGICKYPLDKPLIIAYNEITTKERRYEFKEGVTMAKLYFGSTNAGYLTIAVDADTNRACYLHEDGTEGETYPSRYGIEDKADAEREQIAGHWLRSIANYNNFDSLYADCDIDDGYAGVIPAEGALDGIDVITAIDF